MIVFQMFWEASSKIMENWVRISKGFKISEIVPYSFFSDTNFVPSTFANKPEPQPWFRSALMSCQKPITPGHVWKKTGTTSPLNGQDRRPNAFLMIHIKWHFSLCKMKEMTAVRIFKCVYDNKIMRVWCNTFKSNVLGDSHCLLHTMAASLVYQGLSLFHEQHTQKLCS